MGHLYDIIQRHIDDQRYGASQADIARAVGVSRTTIGNWRNPKELIGRDKLQRLAEVTNTPYPDVLAALLHDIGYVDPPDESDPPPARKRA